MTCVLRKTWTANPFCRLRDPSKATGRVLTTTFDKGNVPHRTTRWRYLRYANGEEELYDLQNDPKERINLADDSAGYKVKSRFAAAWLRQGSERARLNRCPVRSDAAEVHVRGEVKHRSVAPTHVGDALAGHQSSKQLAFGGKNVTTAGASW